MNIESYLKRINYHGPLTPTAETLRDLQLAHLLNVPFENLSIHNHEPIVLDDDALFTKIVEKRRGGFCYEVNGLFAALLRGLGFRVSMLAAEVANVSTIFVNNFSRVALHERPNLFACHSRRAHHAQRHAADLDGAARSSGTVNRSCGRV